MGRRGPPKKPTELKLLQGCPGSRRKLNKHEPKPPKTRGAKPSFGLNKEERKVWRKVVPQLEALGLVTQVDLNALCRYCEAYVLYYRAKAVVDQRGFYYAIRYDPTPEQIAQRQPGSIKYLAQFPEVAIMQNLAAELRRLEQSFGMMPSARASLKVNAPTKSEKDKLREELYG